MREVRRSAILPFTAAQVYGLVTDVERYPEFLPWCTGAMILDDDREYVTVRLSLARGIVRGSFTTRNRLVPERSVEMSLIDGPFDQLEGRWDFTPIGEEGTRADLHLKFQTRGVVGGIALAPVFEMICNQLVDAFGRRAKEVFGGG